MNNTQKVRAEILLEVIKRKIDNNHPEEYLNNYFQPCGTVGCVAGDFMLEYFKSNDWPKIIYENFPRSGGFERFFGFPECGYYEYDESTNYIEVFGSSGFGTLKQRYDYVKFHIMKNGDMS